MGKTSINRDKRAVVTREDFADVHAVNCELANDIATYIVALRKNPESQCMRRGLVRAFMALVEGGSFGMKRLILGLHTHGVIDLSDDEVTLLHEQSINLRENGTIERIPAKITLKRNLRFLVSIVEMHFGGAHRQAWFDGPHWAQVARLNEIRGRLMHPKRTGDLVISSSEAALVEGLMSWYLNRLKLLLDDVVATTWRVKGVAT